ICRAFRPSRAAGVLLSRLSRAVIPAHGPYIIRVGIYGDAAHLSFRQTLLRKPAHRKISQGLEATLCAKARLAVRHAWVAVSCSESGPAGRTTSYRQELSAASLDAGFPDPEFPFSGGASAWQDRVVTSADHCRVRARGGHDYRIDACSHASPGAPG